MVVITRINQKNKMSKKISFSSQADKDEAIAEEKVQHPNPTAYQKQHLVDLEAAVIEA